MIEKASELLERFIEIERSELFKVEMPHMPTLGSAYEEITKQSIDQNFIIPKGLSLKVVSGFISINDKILSNQIDGMLVHGEGKRYGRTSDFIYPIDQVLCIFEVKKTLNKSDYADAFDHLRLIRKEFAKYFELKLKDPSFNPDVSIPGKHFSQITGREAPAFYRDIHSLSRTDAILFYALVQESLAPSSIIHGYGGYSTEYGMRNAFFDILTEKSKLSGEGFGVPSFPTLVTTNNISIVKAHGMPFLGINKNQQWAALVSMRDNAARIMLEIIWSKIAFYFDVKMPWGNDPKNEILAPFLYAIPVHQDGRTGWKFRYVEMKESELKKREFLIDWEPERIDEKVLAVFNCMLINGGYIHEVDLASIAEDHNVSQKDLIKDIMSLFLFKKINQYIRPISSSVFLATDANGFSYLTSNRENLDIWCDKKGLAKDYIHLMIIE
ncbi:hypothetical protein FHW31_000372 [Enterobacter asburiae]|uniref:DUF6602 domain-containing protein n=1 Tax=Enterobacter asburiae TaxID=61645 RepID=UPI00141B17A0|nr:DUF6602 domain-containing protein [Enterobacter asburiae]NIH89007.1 hypothetical protein [Enterobacter asburiae]